MFFQEEGIYICTETRTHRLCSILCIIFQKQLAEKISHQWTKARQTNWKVIFIFDFTDWIPLWFPTFQCAGGKPSFHQHPINLGTSAVIAVNRVSFPLPPAIPSPVLQQDSLPGRQTQLIWRCAKAQLSWSELKIPSCSIPPPTPFFCRFFIHLYHFSSASQNAAPQTGELAYLGGPGPQSEDPPGY